MIKDPNKDELMRQFEVVIRAILNDGKFPNSLTVRQLSCDEKLDLCKIGAREFCLPTKDSLQCYMRATAFLKEVSALARARALAGKPVTSEEPLLAETI
jgi:hypothetical protein